MSVLPSTVFVSEALGLISGDTPYLALYTTDPTAAGTGDEVTGGSYIRKAITFGAISGNSISNTSAVVFTGMPAATVTHFGIRDSVTNGDLLVYGTLNAPVTTIAGDEVNFPIGNISISISGS